MSVWFRLVLVILAGIEWTSCHQTPKTESGNLSAESLKTKKLLALLHEDFQNLLIQGMARNSDTQDHEHKPGKRSRQSLPSDLKLEQIINEHGQAQERGRIIKSLQSLMEERRVNSRRIRRDRLDQQRLQSHSTHVQLLKSKRHRRV